MNTQQEQELRSLLTQAVRFWQSVRDAVDPEQLDVWVESTQERTDLWATILEVEDALQL